MIRPNRIKERLLGGHAVIGPMINFDSVWFVDMAGLSGFDFVVLDAEHGPLSPDIADPLVRAAEMAGMSPLIRVPNNEPHEILRYLDIGAVGIQVPQISNAGQARIAADALRYPPIGNRGFAATTRAAGYGMTIDPRSYAEIANREVMLLAMVETAEAVSNIDAILKTPGVDVIALGPSDLAASLGHTGNPAAAPVSEAIDHVIARVRAAEKWASLPATDAASVRRCMERGANVVMVSPAAFLVKTWQDLLQAVRS